MLLACVSQRSKPKSSPCFVCQESPNLTDCMAAHAGAPDTSDLIVADSLNNSAARQAQSGPGACLKMYDWNGGLWQHDSRLALFPTSKWARVRVFPLN